MTDLTLSRTDIVCNELSRDAIGISIMAVYYVNRPVRRRVTKHYLDSARFVASLANRIIAARMAELAEVAK